MKVKENKGMSLIVFTVVLAILVVVAMGVIVYLLNNPVREKVAIQTPSSVQSNMSNNENNVVNEKPSIDIKENETKVEQVVREMTTDEKYKVFASNLKQKVSTYGDTANIKSVFCRADDGEGSWYEVCLNSNGNLSLRFGKEELDKKYGTKSLAKNVISFYIIDIGQDEWHMIYFINEDGTVGSAYVDPVIFNGTGEIEIKNNISGLKNIVSVLNGGIGLEESGTHTPLFVDIDGKVYHD